MVVHLPSVYKIVGFNPSTSKINDNCFYSSQSLCLTDKVIVPQKPSLSMPQHSLSLFGVRV